MRTAAYSRPSRPARSCRRDALRAEELRRHREAPAYVAACDWAAVGRHQALDRCWVKLVRFVHLYPGAPRSSWSAWRETHSRIDARTGCDTARPEAPLSRSDNA